MRIYDEKIKDLCEYILDKPYGTTLSYDELNKFVGENLKDEYGKNRFRSMIRKVKNKLYPYGYVIKGVLGVGYYILKPNQVSSFTYRTYIVKPQRSYEKARIILNNLEKKRLNKEESQEYALTSALNEELITASEMITEQNRYETLKD